jgi:hypothetical protein
MSDAAMLGATLDRPLGALELLEERGELYVVGGWPPEVRISDDHARRWLRAGADDLIDIRCANGRGIYRLTEWDWSARTWSGRLAYSELEEPGGGIRTAT